MYFFSSRAGGLGGDDLYYVSYHAATNSYGQPVNLGPQINTPKDEWAPITDQTGRHLYFASDGRGGYGKHDLFTVNITPTWTAAPVNLGKAVNSTAEDFDAALLPDGSLVFTSTRNNADKAELFFYHTGALPTLLPFNATDSSWTLGPSIHPLQKGVLYFSGHAEGGQGRTDIYTIRYVISSTKKPVVKKK